MNMAIPIIIQEPAGISRKNEPVTMGIPVPHGMLHDATSLMLQDQDNASCPLPVQAETLACWPDGSIKWLLIDFQVSIAADHTKNFFLTRGAAAQKATGNDQYQLVIEQRENVFSIDTGDATFILNSTTFKPFDQVTIGGQKILAPGQCATVLIDDAGQPYHARIKQMVLETDGPIRKTIHVSGAFQNEGPAVFADFSSRIHFFAKSSLVKVEFTIHNTNAAIHPGGLWDLGDPGSIFFKDLSINATVAAHQPQSILHLLANDSYANNLYQINSSVEVFSAEEIRIYQDSSGGDNWLSPTHVNREGVVKHSFRGYKILSGNTVCKEGMRANPSLTVNGELCSISCAVPYFWQNFPKALESDKSTLSVKLFPEYYNDVHELQGGEQKTHTVYFAFAGRGVNDDPPPLKWTFAPLIPKSTPAWYAGSKAIPYLVSTEDINDIQLLELVNLAVQGDNTFVHRREIIDEYGWRNFGELYADHEAVLNQTSVPFVSHYNNQYDCIYNLLQQFARSGNERWFLLAEQLSAHVSDIDIYHCNKDRPEFNKGLFWHTDHYHEAHTATHRGYSIKNADSENISSHGGGPSLSHCYASGLLLNYYLTGSKLYAESAINLADFAVEQIELATTLCHKGFKILKKIRDFKADNANESGFVQLNKIYEMDGPGRASGNALSTMLDVFNLTRDNKYLRLATKLVRNCIHPADDIDDRDLLDVENRWMYTIFLQALGKYLDVLAENRPAGSAFPYARASLLRYADWIQNNEHLYLDRIEKLEFPNETWPAQDFRKCCILLLAAKYATGDTPRNYIDRSTVIYNKALEQLLGFETKSLTRPLILLLQNAMIIVSSLDLQQNSPFVSRANSTEVTFSRANLLYTKLLNICDMSLAAEIRFVRSKVFRA